jgi:hypothetical protein
MVLQGDKQMARTTRTNTNLRMTWDASIVMVDSTREALAKARALGLDWFDLAEWDGLAKGWVPLGTWAKDHAGRFVSIPA